MSNAIENTAAAAAAAATITLHKVPADYKLAAGEAFLLQGRINKAKPAKPYYHVTMKGSLPIMPTAEESTAALVAALAKLWQLATLDLLKEKASAMDAGATITTYATASDIVTFITELGSRERNAVSGEDVIAFADSYAFQALAQVHAWTPAQVERVTVALRAYCAPAHKKPQADAAVLLNRLQPLATLLTGEDAAEDAAITAVFDWLAAKLKRDSVAEAVNLAEAI